MLPPDPDLKPVAAAEAAMRAMPEFGGAGAAMTSSAPDPAARPGRAAPVVRPADPRLWEVVVALTLPVTVDGVDLNQVTVRRLTAGDVAQLLIEDDDETSLNLRCRAMMCGLHPEVLSRLWADDGLAIAEASRPFLPRAIADIEAGLASGFTDDA